METGVTEVSDVTTNPDETVVQPPDDLVAKEVSAIVNYDSNKDKASRAKASNSAIPSTSTSNTSRGTYPRNKEQEIHTSTTTEAGNLQKHGSIV